ncbi:response regulator transcription factor [Planctomycetota bacterium]
MSEARQDLEVGQEPIANAQQKRSVGPSGPRILVADDDLDMAALVRHRLEQVGFEVLVCQDGDSALKAALRGDVSLYLFDVEMPGFTGFELLRRLRALTRFDGIPIVLMTSLRSEQHVVRAFEAGADDYVIKPFRSREFVARIRRLLENRRPKAQERPQGALGAVSGVFVGPQPGRFV